ncbi:hypothetical protein K438DRAFT_1988726 [Mycena galopus ATCC 62051]|nr:hypothetical protein K438DRAFT_1988726 [Mycena galopus ATCC 62051]
MPLLCMPARTCPLQTRMRSSNPSAPTSNTHPPTSIARPPTLNAPAPTLNEHAPTSKALTHSTFHCMPATHFGRTHVARTPHFKSSLGCTCPIAVPTSASTTARPAARLLVPLLVRPLPTHPRTHTGRKHAPRARKPVVCAHMPITPIACARLPQPPLHPSHKLTPRAPTPAAPNHVAHAHSQTRHILMPVTRLLRMLMEHPHSLHARHAPHKPFVHRHPSHLARTSVMYAHSLHMHTSCTQPHRTSKHLTHRTCVYAHSMHAHPLPAYPHQPHAMSLRT